MKPAKRIHGCATDIMDFGVWRKYMLRFKIAYITVWLLEQDYLEKS